MNSHTVDTSDSNDLENGLATQAAVQSTPTSAEATPVGGTVHAIERATDAVIEEVETIYQSSSRKIVYRDHDRYDFHDTVRICRANLDAAPTGPSMMAEGCNLSLWGVSLIPPEPFDTDDCLLIEFTIRGDGNPRTVTMLAQARHSRPNDAGQETIGCQFLETYCSKAVPAID